VGHWETDKTKHEQSDAGSGVDVRRHSCTGEVFAWSTTAKPVEMTTLYYLDGDQVKLTHYCMAGNQPTMSGSYAPDTRTITFNLVAISNLKSPDDGHNAPRGFTLSSTTIISRLPGRFRKHRRRVYGDVPTSGTK